MEQITKKYPELTYTEALVLKSLGLSEKQLRAHTTIQSVHSGNAYLLVPVKNGKVLDNLTPDLRMIDKISKTLDLIGMYVFTESETNGQNNTSARVFGRRCGTSEEIETDGTVIPTELPFGLTRF